MSERTYYDGKYTVKARTDGGLEFLRYGEAWPAADDLRFSNLVGVMFREQLEADATISALRQRVAELERERDNAVANCRYTIKRMDELDGEWSARVISAKNEVAAMSKELEAAQKVCEAAGAVIDDTRNASYADCYANKGKVCDLLATLAAYRATKEKTDG